MSQVSHSEDCTCATVSAEIHRCETHHVYVLNGKRLDSVSSIIRAVWPVKPTWDGVDSAVVENANHRGSMLDELFSAYVNNTLEDIPAGTRLDIWDPVNKDGLLQKLLPWWDKQGISGARAQVMMHAGDVAGTADIVTANAVIDLKCVWSLQPYYDLQVGGYLWLTGKHPRMDGAFIHVAKRFPEPRWIEVNAAQCVDDWMAVRRVWEIAKRRGVK